jgi:site-specific recombinase XerD
MEKIASVTKEEWQQVNSKNRNIVDLYLESLETLSDDTIKQYTSSIKIYFRWIKDNCENIDFDKIKSRDYLRYQNYLTKIGMSSSGIKFKRSTVSAFNDFIITFYNDIYPTFHNYITKQIKSPPPSFKNAKEPLTIEEIDKIAKYLEENNKWQELAYLLYTYSTGCRRNESRLLLKEVAEYAPVIKSKEVANEKGEKEIKEVKYYVTHDIRCKGSGKIGKVRRLKFDQRAMDALKKWLEVRGEDDCEYMFITKYNGKINKTGETTFSYWCHEIFEPIIGRRIHPHLFRESKATNLVVHEGKSLETAQSLLGHNSSETTKIYVIKDDTDDADDAFM